MTRKCASILCVFFLSFLLNSDMTDIYKKGEIKLVPDPEFGKDTDWKDPLFYKPSSLLVLDDGSIFTAISSHHKIYKLNAKGILSFKFGQKGQGPGDFIGPGNLSILNKKYLVVNEHASNRRISLFDLNGNFNKMIKTRYPIYDSVALKDSKIAILTSSFYLKQKRISIYIRDINSGQEKLIESGNDKLRMIQDSNFTFMASDLQNRGFIFSTINGNLLIGFSYNDTINIYTPEGDKIKSFKLKIKTTPVNQKIIDRYKFSTMEKIKKNFRKPESYLKQIRSSHYFKHLFSKILPLYSSVLLDNQGNILVFYFYFFSEVKFPHFQVYSPSGEYICDCLLNFGDFEALSCDENLKRKIIFRNNQLFAILDKDVNDDIVTKVVKVNLIKNKMEVKNGKNSKSN